jgi:radical SAM superfamily enzyme YgiQ (UPF0313 family)
MMRVLLVYTNRYRPMAPPPIGLAYLLEPLRRGGHEIEVLDLMFSPDPKAALLHTIDDFKPRVAGFSIRNVDNQDMRHIEYFLGEAKELIAMARERGVVTVLGGTAFTTFPAEMMGYTGADYGIAGQGEKSLPLLLRSLGTGAPDKEIPGLAWREGGSVKLNPPDFGGYCGSRARWEALRLDGYKKSFFAGAVLTKSGCPHRCAYCNAAAAFGGSFRQRTPEDVVGEIKSLKARGINVITLTDACFNVPLGYAKEVLKAIVKANVKVYLNTTIVPVRGHFDDELLELYKKAGGIILSLGAEAFSEKMLESYRKPFTLDDVLACAGLLNRRRMPFMVQALFGGPGEDASTVRESMDTLRDVRYARFTYTMGIRLLPGTALYETAKKEGLVKGPSELFTPKFYVSKDLDVRWAEGYIRKRLLRYSYRSLRMLPFYAMCALARRGVLY